MCQTTIKMVAAGGSTYHLRMDDEEGMKYLMTENNDERQKYMQIVNEKS